MQLGVCKSKEEHTPIQAPLKVGVWEGCPAPKSCLTGLFYLSSPPPPIPTEKQSILPLKRKATEGHIAMAVGSCADTFTSPRGGS